MTIPMMNNESLAAEPATAAEERFESELSHEDAMLNFVGNVMLGRYDDPIDEVLGSFEIAVPQTA